MTAVSPAAPVPTDVPEGAAQVFQRKRWLEPVNRATGEFAAESQFAQLPLE